MALFFCQSFLSSLCSLTFRVFFVVHGRQMNDKLAPIDFWLTVGLAPSPHNTCRGGIPVQQRVIKGEAPAGCWNIQTRWLSHSLRHAAVLQPISVRQQTAVVATSDYTTTARSSIHLFSYYYSTVCCCCCCCCCLCLFSLDACTILRTRQSPTTRTSLCKHRKRTKPPGWCLYRRTICFSFNLPKR